MACLHRGLLAPLNEQRFRLRKDRRPSPRPSSPAQLSPFDLRQLGLELDDQGYVKTDLMTMRTSIPGVYAAGDITGAPKQIAVAVSHGSIAAMTAFEDLAAPAGVKPAGVKQVAAAKVS